MTINNMHILCSVLVDVLIEEKIHQLYSVIRNESTLQDGCNVIAFVVHYGHNET